MTEMRSNFDKLVIILKIKATQATAQLQKQCNIANFYICNVLQPLRPFYRVWPANSPRQTALTSGASPDLDQNQQA